MGRPAHGFSLSARRPAGRCSLMPEGTAQQQLGPVGSTVHRARAARWAQSPRPETARWRGWPRLTGGSRAAGSETLLIETCLDLN
jgi:hypothetical protein